MNPLYIYCDPVTFHTHENLERHISITFYFQSQQCSCPSLAKHSQSIRNSLQILIVPDLLKTPAPLRLITNAITLHLFKWVYTNSLNEKIFIIKVGRPGNLYKLYLRLPYKLQRLTYQQDCLEIIIIFFGVVVVCLFACSCSTGRLFIMSRIG